MEKLTGVLFAIGFLLTHALDGSVGRWDQHVNEYFERRRTGTGAITKQGKPNPEDQTPQDVCRIASRFDV